MKISTKIKRVFASRKSRMLTAIVGIAALAAIPLAVKAEFYPVRPTYDYNKPCNANDGDKYDRCGSLEGPVFNSFINTPSYGDERSFLDARRSDQTAAGSYKNVLPEVTEGSKEVVMRVYIHNNANQSTNDSGKGIAKDAKVRIALPTATEQVLRARAYISASNASMVEDTVDMTADEKFSVAYKPGSAIIYSNGAVNGQKINDSVVTNGAQIGYSSLNGQLPGCFQYEAVVQITVTVTPKPTPNLQLTKEVRKSGETAWHKEVEAKPGEEVDWKIATKNISNANLTNVTVRDVLPPHVQLVPGSVRIVDASQDTKQSDGPLFTNNGMITALNQQVGGIRYVVFKAKTLGDFEECQVRVRNVALARSDQTTEQRDDADVVIKKENCKTTENPSYSCDLLQSQIISGRKVKYTATASANNGAVIKRYIYNFGDGTEEFTTDKNSVEHEYAKDGKYVTRVKVEVEVNGETKVAEGDKCATSVNFTTPPETPETPGTPGTPSSLPNTGPGAIVATFLAVTSISSAVYYAIVRKFAGV